MPWDPDKYDQFKSIRYQPFYDLAALVKSENLKTAVDLGCGTGEQTSILAQKFPAVRFWGIDASPEMLSKSKMFQSENVAFYQMTTEELIAAGKTADLVFSNAALQWSDDHEKLFPAIIAMVNAGGQFAVQMPVQNENLLNIILAELVQEKPFADFLQGWKRESPVLNIDEYAQIMFDNGLHSIQIIQKVYPIIAENPDTLFDFISGSALIPYLERMNESRQELFITAYKTRLQQRFPRFPAIYAFKRLLLYGRK